MLIKHNSLKQKIIYYIVLYIMENRIYNKMQVEKGFSSKTA